MFLAAITACCSCGCDVLGARRYWRESVSCLPQNRSRRGLVAWSSRLSRRSGSRDRSRTRGNHGSSGIRLGLAGWHRRIRPNRGGQSKRPAVLWSPRCRWNRAFLKRVVRPPKFVIATIERMFALRDVLAHVFYLHPDEPAIRYKGLTIFSEVGLQTYVVDVSTPISWLLEKVRELDRRARRRVRHQVRKELRQASVAAVTGARKAIEEGI